MSKLDLKAYTNVIFSFFLRNVDDKATAKIIVPLVFKQNVTLSKNQLKTAVLFGNGT